MTSATSSTEGSLTPGSGSGSSAFFAAISKGLLSKCMFLSVINAGTKYKPASSAIASTYLAASTLARGKLKPKVLPLPSTLLKMIAPPWAAITFLAMNKPKPVPSGRIFLALPAL
jgi:hypothetical protein